MESWGRPLLGGKGFELDETLSFFSKGGTEADAVKDTHTRNTTKKRLMLRAPLEKHEKGM